MDRDSITVFLLSDVFSRFFHPQTESAALKLLSAAGIEVQVLSTLGSGRTFLSKGFLANARDHLKALLDEIYSRDPQGVLPILGLEPSEIYTLRDELLDLLPKDEFARQLSQRAWMVEEYLLRPGPQGVRPVDQLDGNSLRARPRVKLHGHCYQKAQPPAADGLPVGTQASQRFLAACGAQVEVIPSGCCGMAGAFGYEAEHYQLSMAVGELVLLPEVRAADTETWIAAAGTSCRSQILDGTGRQAYHPLEVACHLLDLN